MSDERTGAKFAEKFVVRLPNGMRQRIAEAARTYRRSMNSEIVARLAQSLAGRAGLDETPPSDEAAEGAEFASGGARTTALLSELEIRLINAYRRMPDRKRRSLLELIG